MLKRYGCKRLWLQAAMQTRYKIIRSFHFVENYERALTEGRRRISCRLLGPMTRCPKGPSTTYPFLPSLYNIFLILSKLSSYITTLLLYSTLMLKEWWYINLKNPSTILIQFLIKYAKYFYIFFYLFIFFIFVIYLPPVNEFHFKSQHMLLFFFYWLQIL